MTGREGGGEGGSEGEEDTLPKNRGEEISREMSSLGCPFGRHFLEMYCRRRGSEKTGGEYAKAGGRRAVRSSSRMQGVAREVTDPIFKSISR